MISLAQIMRWLCNEMGTLAVSKELAKIIAENHVETGNPHATRNG